MATTKPRITLTMDQELYSLYRDLAEAQGRSMSAIIVDLLDATAPVQQQVLQALRRALSVQEEGRADMLASLEKAQATAEGMLSPAMGIFDEFLSSLPPHSNTGVTPPYPPTPPTQEIPAKRHSRAVPGQNRSSSAAKREKAGGNQ